ncbi:hypothetical protein L2E82_03853 [Cichorium intybus]|uniref:Uncharacterized protein n=1 Tax=Cichorium intybus TaxID=13427 RepID=A0ACB9H4H4_CICIN|nr:hypothetical protein L2E82_03853 [Cichorium intybus]
MENYSLLIHLLLLLSREGSYPITYIFGAWSEDHGVLGVYDSTDTLYFIRANGEEITRITKQHLKVSLPIISFVIHDDKNVKKSCLCTFSILASDGSVHDIEISQDPSTYSISLWQWCRQSGLQQVSSFEFEGLYTKTKGYTDQMSSPKVVFSPQGEFIATVDNDNEVAAAFSMSPMYPWSSSEPP